RLLLEHGIDVNAQDNNCSTALHLASRGKLEVAYLLLEHGADMEAEDNSGRTPLQVASEQQHDEITKLLSERGIVGTRSIESKASQGLIHGNYESPSLLVCCLSQCCYKSKKKTVILTWRCCGQQDTHVALV
ncbi:ankyrin repeat-containing domain protein, partial [Russula vinacea]